MIIKNTLNCTGQIQLSNGSSYTLKSDEVLINSVLYKKIDLEISIQNLGSVSDDDVKIAIRKRDGLSGLPANFVKYAEWSINGVNQTSLSSCVENITTCIFPASNDINFTDLLDTPSDYSGKNGFYVVVKEDGTGLEFKSKINKGTYSELKNLVDNNKLEIGTKYELTDYKTKYYIEGSNSGSIEKEFENTQTVSGWGYFEPPLSDLSLGDTVVVTSLPASYSGAISVGDNTTISQFYSGGYYVKFANGLHLVIGSKFSYTVDRFKVNTSLNGATVMSNGKPVLKPDGVINTDVHDGTPYMDMTASENKSVNTERILLTAISENKFSIKAESLTYVGDLLEYDFNDINIKNEDGKVIGSRNGLVIKRENRQLKISVDKDWREQRYRRYLVNQDWESFVLNNPTDHSLYNIGTDNACTTSNTAITNEHKYILPYVENLNFYNDFTKNGVESNVFLTGEATAPYVVYADRFETNSQDDFKQNIISTAPQKAKDLFIFELDTNNDPINVEVFSVSKLSNSVFRGNDFQYGKSGKLSVEIYDGISLSTFVTYPKIFSKSSQSEVSIQNVTAIDYIYLSNTGFIYSLIALSTSYVKNSGEINYVAIGSFKSNVTGFGVSNIDIQISETSIIRNSIFGGKRVDRLVFDNVVVNKFLYAVTRSQYWKFSNSFIYLTGMKYGGTVLTSRLSIDLGTRKNSKKNLFGFYYDSFSGDGANIYDNNVGDLLYNTIDGNNMNQITVNTFSISQ